MPRGRNAFTRNAFALAVIVAVSVPSSAVAGTATSGILGYQNPESPAYGAKGMIYTYDWPEERHVSSIYADCGPCNYIEMGTCERSDWWIAMRFMALENYPDTPWDYYGHSGQVQFYWGAESNIPVGTWFSIQIENKNRHPTGTPEWYAYRDGKGCLWGLEMHGGDAANKADPRTSAENFGTGYSFNAHSAQQLNRLMWDGGWDPWVNRSVYDTDGYWNGQWKSATWFATHMP